MVIRDAFARILWLIGVLCVASPPAAQQSTNQSFSPSIRQPAYGANGPVLAIDEAHNNFHILSGSYAPFARLAAADGYRVCSIATQFSAPALAGIAVLVVANARAPDDEQSAFTADEVQALTTWIAGGGSLFLIADHKPFGTAVAALSQRFGVHMDQGYVAVQDHRQVTTQIRFEGQLLGSHPIVQGRGSREKVRRVTSFTGQSLSVPAGATSILIIPKDALEVSSPKEIADLRNGKSVLARHAGGRSQLVALSFGRGRVVVAGEAAMFTSQEVRLPDGGHVNAGLRVGDNQQFTLNVLHWLSRLIN